MNEKKKSEPVIPKELHVCMGLNACAGLGKDGSGSMAGTGNCATAFHVCHGLNNCRGQGACGYLGTPEQQGHPGENPCKTYGSCASPINEGRTHSAGVNKGKSVWMAARKLFEQRMYTVGVPFGPSPGRGVANDLPKPWERESNSCNGCGSSADVDLTGAEPRKKTNATKAPAKGSKKPTK